MTDQPQHLTPPADIPIGATVTFSCIKCSFHFSHVWLSSDGTRFGDSYCYMHNPTVTMFITSVVEKSEEPPPTQ